MSDAGMFFLLVYAAFAAVIAIGLIANWLRNPATTPSLFEALPPGSDRPVWHALVYAAFCLLALCILSSRLGASAFAACIFFGAIGIAVFKKIRASRARSKPLQ